MSYIEEYDNFLDQIRELKNVTDGENIEIQPYQYGKNKKAITYLYTKYNRESIYTVFNNWYVLNMLSDKYKVFLANIEDCNKLHFDEQEIKVSKNYFLTSDYLVFPFLTIDLKPVIDEIILNFNQSITNGDIQPRKRPEIVYLVDFDFMNINQNKKNYLHYKSEKVKNQIIQNCRNVDRVILKNENLFNNLLKEIMPKIKGGNTNYSYNSSYLNTNLIENIDAVKIVKKPDQALRIGILVSKYNQKDLKSISKTLKEFQEKNKFKIKFIAYGDEKANLKLNLSGVDYEFQPSGNLEIYYNELVNLQLNAIIIPANKNNWNRDNYDIERVFELMAIGVPCIVSDIEPIKNYLVDEKTGFLYKSKEHLKRILTLISEMPFEENESNLLEQISLNAKNYVYEEKKLLSEIALKNIENQFD
tara:strand:+ start:3158 stop:4408 length:1251 start_codon:yes stop_codon:yes gene_type:complete